VLADLNLAAGQDERNGFFPLSGTSRSLERSP